MIYKLRSECNLRNVLRLGSHTEPKQRNNKKQELNASVLECIFEKKRKRFFFCFRSSIITVLDIATDVYDFELLRTWDVPRTSNELYKLEGATSTLHLYMAEYQ